MIAGFLCPHGNPVLCSTFLNLSWLRTRKMKLNSYNF
ncbi:TPA: molecular chaperone, partial [Acinetobacter baumannii]|nr:molecular chaperone [Acinetobacter baumannii]HAV6019539.1 molecular chaperone [Acinetobacter baumannii]HAV6063702.1 molecular chaperone [Acinetobacter baumannii]HAV6067609.1 molecular chaperone [Acinetobacter baumannii]HAV6119114.1 molecular chaperone [Acinetobacter baumannii]